MSFSAEIKNELCRESINKKCCAQAEICGILFFGGVITEENGVCSFRFTTESKAVTERCYCLFNKVTEGEFFPLRLVTSVLAKRPPVGENLPANIFYVAAVGFLKRL